MRKRFTMLVTLGTAAILGVAGTTMAFAGETDAPNPRTDRSVTAEDRKAELPTPTSLSREEAVRIALEFVGSGEYHSMTLHERDGRVQYWVNVMVRGKIQVIEVDPADKKASRSTEGERAQADYIREAENPSAPAPESPRR